MYPIGRSSQGRNLLGVRKSGRGQGGIEIGKLGGDGMYRLVIVRVIGRGYREEDVNGRPKLMLMIFAS